VRELQVGPHRHHEPVLKVRGVEFPEHFHHRLADPTKPTKGWRTAWRAIAKEAGLGGFRFYDLRHTAITDLAESQASEQTIMGIAGHISREMLEHYSHIRLDAKRKALDAQVKKLRAHARQGYVTKHGTTSQKPGRKAPQLIEGIGGPHGIRTHDLLVANEALSHLS
jgi:hypothetical protein